MLSKDVESTIWNLILVLEEIACLYGELLIIEELYVGSSTTIGYF